MDDVDGVILLRPTVSPIIYKQQIGRALSANKKKKTIVFDIVLNIENLYSIGAIEKEMEVAMAYCYAAGQESLIVNEHFKVVDEVRDSIELFKKLNKSLSASWELMYEEAKAYLDTYGDLDVPQKYKTPEGFSLGSWLNTQRLVYNGKTKGVLTEEQVQKLDD